MLDLKDELRQLADDAASQARPLAVADVIRRADRRHRRGITGWRHGSAPARGRRWPGWLAPLAAAAAVTAVVAATVIVPSALHGSGPAGGHRSAAATVYVSFQSWHGGKFAGTVVPISTATNRPGKPIRLPYGPPSGMVMVMTPDGKTVYVTAGQGSIPISTATNRPGKPIHVDGVLTIDPDGRTAYAVDPLSGTLTPVDLATGKPGQPIRLRPVLGAVVFTPDGKTAYVAGMRAVTPISTATNRPGRPIPLSGRGYAPRDIAITPDGKTVYAGGLGIITPISTATNRPGKPIRFSGGGGPGIAITPDGKTAYVGSGDTVTPISTATNTPGKPIRLGIPAEEIVVTPDGKTVYVANYEGPIGTVVPISTTTNRPGKPIRLPYGRLSGIVTTP